MKRSKLSRHALRINQVYFENHIGAWDREAIQRRGEELTGVILEIWPAFGTPPVVVNYKGRTPSRLVICGEHYDVDSWRAVALQVMEFAIENVGNFNHFAENLQSAYLSTEEKPRTKQLSNGWYLYISLTADSVMTLCSRVFEQLDLSDEEWEVKLLEDAS